MGTPHDDEDWNSYRRLVMDNQTTLREGFEQLRERVGKIELKMAQYGVLSGIGATIVAEIVKHYFLKP